MGRRERVRRRFWEENQRRQGKGKGKEMKKKGKKERRKIKKEGKEIREGKGVVAGHGRWSPAAAGDGRKWPEMAGQKPKPKLKRVQV